MEDYILIITVTGSYGDNIESYKFFSRLQHKCISSSDSEISINFDGCGFIHANLMVIIGTLPVLGAYHKKKITLDYGNASPTLKKYFFNSGVCQFYGSEVCANDNAIPFKKIDDMDHIEEYVAQILDRAPITLVQDARDVLSSRLYEVFANSFEHSKSPIGVFCCGHWMPYKKCLVFSTYDAGIGIPKSVNTYLDKAISDIESMEWACTSGNSTQADNVDYPRGLGLNQLQSFVHANSGKMALYSGGAYYNLENKVHKVGCLEDDLCGTLFSMNIVADENHIYILK